MGKILQYNLSSLSYISYFFSYANFFHNRRHLSNVSENVLEVENTGWGLKEAIPEHLPAQDRSPSLYEIPFPLSEVPLKSQPSCLGQRCPKPITLHCHEGLSHPGPCPSYPPFLSAAFPSIGLSKTGTRSLPSLRKRTSPSPVQISSPLYSHVFTYLSSLLTCFK